LRQIIQALPVPEDERILCGIGNAEDAAVYKIDDNKALILSIDVITPLVDDAKAFGAIAAANALSDIFAMGGQGVASLSFISTPSDIPDDIRAQIMQGAGELALANGAPILGGHSVEGKDLYMGLAVIGEGKPDHLLTNDSLEADLALILTKPIGTGTLTTAVKNDALSIDDIGDALEGMQQTNRAAVNLMLQHGAKSATDITGFGLLGHLAEQVRASNVQAVIQKELIPIYENALKTIDMGYKTRANARNGEYVHSQTEITGEIDTVLLDPQTSGGLLIAVPRAESNPLQEELVRAGYKHTREIGFTQAGTGIILN
tara:strand:- start:503 stop:1453 length:951 start_codon:yes stop_codon:yes gene_type:complete